MTHTKNNEYKKGIEDFEFAEKILKQLSDQDFKKYGSDYAELLKFKAKTYNTFNQYKDAEDCFNESLRLYKEFEKYNNPRFKYYLLELYTDMGEFYHLIPVGTIKNSVELSKNYFDLAKKSYSDIELLPGLLNPSIKILNAYNII